MSNFIDRTGQIFNEIKVVQELGGQRVIGECIYCHSRKEYNKKSLVAGRSSRCKCRSIPKYEDKTGQTFNGIKIVQELGKGRVIGECTHCKSHKEYDKYTVTRNQIYSCGCARKPQFIDRTNKIYGGIKVIKELDYDRVIGQCIYCNDIREYEKKRVVRGGVYSCGCKRKGATNLVGQIFNGLQVTAELRDNKVKAKCIVCEHEDIYIKNALKSGDLACKNKECKNSLRKKRIKSTVGQCFGTFKVIEDAGEGVVKAQCIRCKHIDSYGKNELITNKVQCKKCGIQSTRKRSSIENLTFGTVKVLSYEYEGRDKKPYYMCKCLTCNTNLLLNYDEIFTYSCNNNRCIQ